MKLQFSDKINKSSLPHHAHEFDIKERQEAAKRDFQNTSSEAHCLL